MKNLEVSFTSDIIFRYYGEHTGRQEHSYLLWKEFTGIQSLRIENYMPHLSAAVRETQCQRLVRGAPPYSGGRHCRLVTDHTLHSSGNIVEEGVERL